MPAGKSARERSREVTYEVIADALVRAIRDRDDLVLAWERSGNETGPEDCPVVHVITGNLVTPCRLNGITGRAHLYDDEGATVITGIWRDEGTPNRCRGSGKTAKKR
ncbi:MAG: hypothetical protein WC342_09245 [Methanoregula sp.]|jgi:hypothetical protein